MTKSEIAEQLYRFTCNYMDYLTTGVSTCQSMPDFSQIENTEIEKTEETPFSEFSTSSSSPPPLLNQTEQTKPEEQQTTDKRRSKTLAMVELAKEILKCKECPFCKISQNRLPGLGLVSSKIFVIANPVSVAEEKANHPLAEKEREFFHKWLTSIDINPDSIFLTNILKCSSGNSQIKVEFIEACRKHLDRQLELVSPNLIITLGQIVLSSLKRSSANLINEHGTLLDYNGYKIFPLFDPASVLNNLSLKVPLWEDLKKLKSILLSEKT